MSIETILLIVALGAYPISLVIAKVWEALDKVNYPDYYHEDPDIQAYVNHLKEEVKDGQEG